MTQEDFIRKAIAAVFDVLSPSEDMFGRRIYTGSDDEISDELECFAKGAYAAGVVDEREACAQVCEPMRPSKEEFDQRYYAGCTDSAAAIRARGEK